MDLISEKYIKLNNKLHETNLLYGTSTTRYTKTILKIINDYKITEMIDYGCGKQLAKTFLPKNVSYFPYDPAFTELNILPPPKDFNSIIYVIIKKSMHANINLLCAVMV